MPATPTFACIRGEEDVGKKGSVLGGVRFNITFTLGWCMVFVTAVCFIAKRHRKRLARHEAAEAGMDRVDSQSEHENPPRLVKMRSGMTGRNHVTLPRVILSDETLVREPPPAYIPAGNSSWQDDAEEFLWEWRAEPVAGEVRVVIRHAMDVLVDDISTYSTDPAEAGVGLLMPIDAGGLRLCGL